MLWTSFIFTSTAAAAVSSVSPRSTSPTVPSASESHCFSCSPGKKTRALLPLPKRQPNKAEAWGRAPIEPMATNHARSPLAALRSILIAGPTAVGKSEVALALAERIGGEIISVDAMQVYRGLDIGTAKPAPRERQRVRHHL